MNDREIMDHFGEDTLSILNASIQKAYSMAALFIEESEFFKIPSAWPQEQNIRNLSVDLAIQKACETGLIPLAYSYPSNQRHNYNHLVLKGENIFATHSSVRRKDEFPRIASIRRHLAMTNQICLFGEENHKPEAQTIYGILLHKPENKEDGAAFVALGIPDAEYGAWCNHIPLADLSKISLATPTKSEYDEFNLKLRRNALIQKG